MGIITVDGAKVMINVILSKEEYEYDVYILIKAFFPYEQILINKEEFDETGLTIELEFLPSLLKGTVKKEGLLLYEVTKEAVGEGKSYKNQAKRVVYQLLKKVTGEELPWGILTGVRPTKLALEPLEEGISEESIRDYFLTEYLCTEEKTQLSLQVAKNELNILTSIDYKNSYSIYIGIPFCPTTCLYCSFTSYPIEKCKHMVDDYLKALKKEITYSKNALNKKLSTIYVGGGTPTSLSHEHLEELLIHIDTTFDTSKLLEYTVEAGRPDSITEEKLRLLKKYGVTRISINPQSMVQRTLDVIGRKHSVDDVRNVFLKARELGHNNINMDIIIGLPGENKEDVVYTLKEIEKLDPENLTVHTLALKRAARLNLEKDNYKDLTPTDTKEMLYLTSQYAREHNYIPYYLYRQKNMTDNLENTGYSKPGMEGIYNMLIMEEKQTILALGAGALSKFVFHNENRIERVENVKSLNDYVERIDEMIERKKTFLSQNLAELERNF